MIQAEKVLEKCLRVIAAKFPRPHEHVRDFKLPWNVSLSQCVAGTGARRSRGLRTLIRQADPDVVEEWKWRGGPTWEHGGIICTGETYKNFVKMTFAKGAPLEDPSGLFNSSLEGNTRRTIDFYEGDRIEKRH
jgi:hypothetical protein